VPKMHAICNPYHRVSFPELANKDLMDVMRRCLDRDPKSRITLQVIYTRQDMCPGSGSTCFCSLCERFREFSICTPLLAYGRMHAAFRGGSPVAEHLIALGKVTGL
jgi:hypothetical protein